MALEPPPMNETTSAVIARLDRATQYSRDGRVQPRSRGVLDRPVKPGDDSLVMRRLARNDEAEFDSNVKQQMHVRDLAAGGARGLRVVVPQTGGSRECRMHAAPAVSCAKLCKKCAHEHTGQRRRSDIPCAMALRLITRSPRRIGLCCCLLYTSPSPRDGLLSRMPS